ncbi:MAG: YidC/Oxa1 family membrane protein insertase [Patescibacteria group bacterium]|jgi:YidC/Oxa1 family membrane protein insertase|nr:YidC/Oxa1 family membrane protein insertase [Patescibacteria group bacterium]
MTQLFNVLLFQPLLNLLVFIYNMVPGNDLGVAIIIVTIIIKLLLYPLSHQSIKSQKALQDLQPKMNELKKKYKDDKEALARETMNLYKQEKVNPLSSCLPLLIQLPFLLAVFSVFSRGLNGESLNLLYPFVANPGQLNPWSFGLLNLSTPNIFLAALTGLAQFWQSKMLITKRQPKVAGAKDEDMTAIMNKQMLYFMPIITVVIGASLPAGLIVYWLTTTLLTILQQKTMFRNKPNSSVEVIDTK